MRPSIPPKWGMLCLVRSDTLLNRGVGVYAKFVPNLDGNQISINGQLGASFFAYNKSDSDGKWRKDFVRRER